MKDACEIGTVPVRPATLEDVARFRTLDDFFKKAAEAPLSVEIPARVSIGAKSGGGR